MGQDNTTAYRARDNRSCSAVELLSSQGEGYITILIFKMNRTLVLLLGVLLFTSLTCGLKKKYLDSDGDGENDADDDDDDNDGIDDDDDDDDDGDGIPDDDQDYDGDGMKNKDDDDDDGDGISDKNDKDDDGDGVDDSTGQNYKSGKPESVWKEKSGAVEGMVFAYFFGLASMLLKNV